MKVKDVTPARLLRASRTRKRQAHFAAALQELDQFGEAYNWLRESLDLSAAELCNLPALNLTDLAERDEADDEVQGEPLSEVEAPEEEG